MRSQTFFQFLLRPHMTNAGGNSRPSAPVKHDQRMREFSTGRLAGRAHWQATPSRTCGLVRPVTQRKSKPQLTKIDLTFPDQDKKGFYFLTQRKPLRTLNNPVLKDPEHANTYTSSMIGK